MVIPLVQLKQEGNVMVKEMEIELGCMHPVVLSYIRFKGFRLTQHCFDSCLLFFFQIIHYMFRPYDHLQVEIYTSEINMTGP
jgi:hypothetical protein